jgi:hypothetical protein
MDKGRSLLEEGLEWYPYEWRLSVEQPVHTIDTIIQIVSGSHHDVLDRRLLSTRK